ncbi:MAG: hypothetical protein NC913_06920 [Candidatus Omnitrophica bacterium]|nr:hypothetical protein [Candidatus Omnitrophota bacterium]
MKKFFLTEICIFALLSFISVNLSAQELKPLSHWPIAGKLKGITIVVAETEELQHQGFCNASAQEFQNIAIWFPKIKKGTVFVNTNPGYGCVEKDIQVVFLDKNWVVIEIMFMEKKTGTAVAPENTFSAIEGIPEIINKLGFKACRQSPIKIIKNNGKYSMIKTRER